MKKRTGILALTLAAGCALGLTGCASGGTNAANLSSNWFSYTSTKIIQPSILEEENCEEITYDVTYTPQKNSSLDYTVNYENATYSTLFKALKIDGETLRTITDAEYNRTEYTEKGDITAYYYETNYSIDVTYTYGSNVKPFKDSTQTICYFLSVGDRLRPLYSKQTIKSTSPSNNGYYKELDVVYESFYKFNGSAVKTYTTDNLKTENKTKSNTVSLGGAANTLFDVAQFNIVVRATNLSAGSSLSQAVSLYSPADGATGNFTLKGTGSALKLDKDAEKNQTELAELKGKLTTAGLFVPATTAPAEGEQGEPVEKPLSTVAATVTYNGELEGVSQTYWFTAIENPYNNKGKATMLKMSTPLPFGLGTLDYTLKSIESTF